MIQKLRYKIDKPKDKRYNKIKDESPLRRFKFEIDISEDQLRNAESRGYVVTVMLMAFCDWQTEQRSELGGG